MLTNRYRHLILFIVFLIALAFPASATEIINESIIDITDTSKAGELGYSSGTSFTYENLTGFYARDISLFDDISYFTLEVGGPQGYWPSGELIPTGRHETTYTYNGETKPAVIYVSRNTNLLGKIISTNYVFFPQDWDRQGLTGPQSINTPLTLVDARGSVSGDHYRATTLAESSTNLWLCNKNGEPRGLYSVPAPISHATSISWENNLRVATTDDKVKGYTIDLIRTVNDITASSTIEIYQNTSLVYANTGTEDLVLWYPQTAIDIIKVTSPIRTHSYDLKEYTSGEPGEPGEPSEPTPTLRTGTVTMTDHNGTTIRGFEVKAVNYYTGEEYTTSTQSDVATITLPMDRTISLRNPQTGQYEDVPVGYYTFFVYKPGYKMTSEDGVRISVLPEEYSSYHLGDIIVTSEDGYLTGKHQFQIRSRADKRILQTGTISAQSATTGEWYNTTVVDGIATLILPYDTSTPYYKYVGNYYVYATSPGYIPSEYATQISVRPDTQSEIRWIMLTPIGGIPDAGNVTLRIQTFSDSWQEIPNAEIHIDGVEGQGWEIWETYTASATGYAEISVPGNSTYDITVSAKGYYSSSQRIEVGDTDPPLMEIILYPTGAPTLTPPTTQPTGWITPIPTTKPPGIPDEDDKSEGFLMEAIRGISRAFGVGFETGKIIFGMLLALAIGFATAKHLRGGAAEFGLGLLGGTMLGVLIGLLPIWTIVVLLLIVGMYIGYRYVGGGNNG